jgi:hypothetical protein
MQPTQPQTDTQATEALYRRTTPEAANAQNYLFKIRYHRIKAKVNVRRDATKWGTNRELPEQYQNELCPACKEEIDTTTHHIKCKRTCTIAKQLPRNILTIINKYRRKNNKKEKLIQFPSWYWVHGGPRMEPGGVLPLAKEAVTMGHLPATLKKRLEWVGVDPKHNLQCRVDIQIAIANNFHKRWLHRCKTMMQNSKTK